MEQLELDGARAEWKRAGGYDWTRCPRCGEWQVWSRASPVARLAELHHIAKPADSPRSDG